MKFSELDLHSKVVAGIQKNDFVECTPIQEKCIPPLLLGQDVAGLAQTGTGKTAAFLLPMMDRILRSKEGQGTDEEAESKRPIFKSWKDSNFVLVLVPTRELAEQVYENAKNLGSETGLGAAVIYGGTGYDKQKAAIASGVEFVIATPGRLIDLYKDHTIDLNQVRAVIFDEADRMFDMGFKDDMCYILKRIPRDRQFLLFSATLNFDVLNVAYEFGSDPVEIDVSRDTVTADNVKDEIFHVGHDDKPGYLISILKKHKPNQAIIFSNFKRNVDRIARFLTNNNVPAMGISSLLTQAQRNRVMSQFRADNNNQNILVATDVAARGLDIKGVDLVINFELPDDPENYVHRIGRTGRAGETGQAFSFVSDRDVDALSRIESYLGDKLAIGWLEDGEILTDFEAFPRDEGHRGRKPGGHRAGGGQRRSGGGDRNKSRRGGGGRHGEKSGQRRDRNKNRNRSEAQGSGEESKEMRHRDRRTGRHEEQNKKNHRKKRGKNNQHRNKKSKSHLNKKRKGGRYRPEGSKAAKPKTMGQKVSGFFKKLFS